MKKGIKVLRFIIILFYVIVIYLGRFLIYFGGFFIKLNGRKKNKRIKDDTIIDVEIIKGDEDEIW